MIKINIEDKIKEVKEIMEESVFIEEYYSKNISQKLFIKEGKRMEKSNVLNCLKKVGNIFIKGLSMVVAISIGCSLAFLLILSLIMPLIKCALIYKIVSFIISVFILGGILDYDTRYQVEALIEEYEDYLES